MGYKYSTPEIEVIMFQAQDVMAGSSMDPAPGPSPKPDAPTTQPTSESGWTQYY